jgi:hypothetical protein
MMVHFLVEQLPGMAIGTFLVGPFIPGVLRKVKAVFVKESAVVKADVEKKAAVYGADLKKKL